MLDYIIVGLGLSGIAVGERLEERGFDFHVFEDASQKASLVSGGVFNPIILKRFTLAWKADEQIEMAVPFYKKISQKLDVKLLHSKTIYRKFYSANEQNNWFSALDKPALSPFLDSEIIRGINPNIPAEFGFGKVLKTGYVETRALIENYRNYLEGQNRISFQSFQHRELKCGEDFVEYKGKTARKVIFCEGFGISENPFFNYLPLTPNKGEYLIISSKELKLKDTVKASVFISPLGGDNYAVGATYNHKDTSPDVTVEARAYLVKKLEGLITCEYEVVDQVAGIRPATVDRKPFLGRHPRFKNLYCCNGFGSRGVLIAPMVSRDLLDFSENEIPLPEEVDIARFSGKYYSA